jgi:hypothetical protein
MPNCSIEIHPRTFTEDYFDTNKKSPLRHVSLDAFLLED